MTEQEYIACVYHSFFNYTLSKEELLRWRAGKKMRLQRKLQKKQSFKLSGKQIQNRKFSIKKLKIASKAADLLGRIPFVLFVGITGSLAMNNAKPQSDIDFMIITQKNTLWITRIIALLILPLHKNKLRRARNPDEKDKICLNLWLDESALNLPQMPRTAYTAHEVAQVIPLVNKSKTYEKWLYKNKWILEYWPYAARIRSVNSVYSRGNTFIALLNILSFLLQRIYMTGKMTREQVDIHYSYFHPFDWGEIILKKLSNKGITSTTE